MVEKYAAKNAHVLPLQFEFCDTKIRSFLLIMKLISIQNKLRKVNLWQCSLVVVDNMERYMVIASYKASGLMLPNPFTCLLIYFLEALIKVITMRFLQMQVFNNSLNISSTNINFVLLWCIIH